MPSIHPCNYYTDEAGRKGCRIAEMIGCNVITNEVTITALYDSQIEALYGNNHFNKFRMLGFGHWIFTTGRVDVSVKMNKYCSQCGHSVLYKDKGNYVGDVLTRFSKFATPNCEMKYL